MDEAKAFSRDVTGTANEKGVFDHMESCKVYLNFSFFISDNIIFRI